MVSLSVSTVMTKERKESRFGTNTLQQHLLVNVTRANTSFNKHEGTTRKKGIFHTLEWPSGQDAAMSLRK